MVSNPHCPATLDRPTRTAALSIKSKVPEDVLEPRVVVHAGWSSFVGGWRLNIDDRLPHHLKLVQTSPHRWAEAFMCTKY